MTATDLPNSPLTINNEPHRQWWHRPWFLRAGSVAFLLSLAILTTLPGYLPGRTLAPTDALKMSVPWNRSAALDSFVWPDHGYRLSVAARSLAPWHQAVAQLKSRRIPLWNPHQALGQPLLGSGQIAPFYPANLLHIALPPTWSYTLIATLQLFLAGLGTWLLARHYHLRPLPALLAASIFMLSGLHLISLHTNAVLVTPWLPFAILITEKLIQRTTLSRLALTIVIFALQFLGADPVASAAIILTCFTLLLLRPFLDPQSFPTSGIPSDSPPDRSLGCHAHACVGMPLENPTPPMRYLRALRATVALIVSLAIAFALAGVQWAPILDVFRHTVPNPDAPHNTYLPWGIALFHSAPLAPDFIGATSLILACCGLALAHHRRLVWTYTLLAACGFAFLIAARCSPDFVTQLAALGFVATPLLLLPTALALALLAGIGLDGLLHQLPTPDPRRVRRAVYLAAGGILLVLAGSIGTWLVRNPSWLLGTIRLAVILIILAAGFVLWMRGIRGQHQPQFLAWATLALVLIDLLAFALPHTRGARAGTYFPSSPVLASLQSQPTPSRLAADLSIFPPNLASAYALDDARGAAPRIPPRLVPWLAKLPNAGSTSRPTTTAPAQADPASLFNVRHLISATPAIYENPAALPRAWIVARTQPRSPSLPSPQEVFNQLHSPWTFNPRDTVLVDANITDAFRLAIEAQAEWTNWFAKSGAGQGRGTVEYVRKSADEVLIKVRNSGGGWLVVSDLCFPGWQATVTDLSAPRASRPPPPGQRSGPPRPHCPRLQPSPSHPPYSQERRCHAHLSPRRLALWPLRFRRRPPRPPPPRRPRPHPPLAPGA